MTKSIRLAAVAIAAVAVLAPATAAQAASKTASECSPWTSTHGLKVRDCMAMAPSGSKQKVTGRLQVKNATSAAKTIAASVTVGGNGSADSATGSVVVPAGATRTIATKTMYFSQDHGNVYSLGSMTSPIKWGSYTLTMTY